MVATDVAGLRLWPRIASLSGLSDGAAVATWADSSGLGNDTTGPAAHRPTYKATAGPTGGGCVRFDGSASWLTFPAVTLTEFTLFVAVKATGDGAILGNQSGPLPQARYGQSGANVLSTYDGSSNPQSGTLAAAQGTWTVVSFRRTGTTVTFRQDGTDYGTGANAGSLTWDLIGAFQTGFSPANLLNGDVVELALWDSGLAGSDLSGMDGYFAGLLSGGGGGGPAGGPFPWFLDQSHSGGFFDGGL